MLQEYIQTEKSKITQEIFRQINTLNACVKPVALHILDSNGKNLRPILFLLVARCLNVKNIDLYPLAAALEILHSATLLHDDILDNAGFRRNKKSAHLIFGQKQTILAGDVLFALANSISVAYNDSKVIQGLAKATMQVVQGQLLEDSVLHTLIDQSVYIEIIKNKTASMLWVASYLGAVVSRAGSNLRQASEDFGLNLGIAFQLVDDALDFSYSNETGKPVAGDLHEGKLTLPLFLLLEEMSESERQKFIGKFAVNSFSEQDIENIIFKIRDLDLINKARKWGNVYLARAEAALAMFPANSEKELLKEIILYVENRSV